MFTPHPSPQSHMLALFLHPIRFESAHFQFPAWVEICRVKNLVPVPAELEHNYFDSLKAIRVLVASWAEKIWSDSDLAYVMSELAVAKGHVAIAETALELTDAYAADALEWFYEH